MPLSPPRLCHYPPLSSTPIAFHFWGPLPCQFVVLKRRPDERCSIEPGEPFHDRCSRKKVCDAACQPGRDHSFRHPYSTPHPPDSNYLPRPNFSLFRFHFPFWEEERGVHFTGFKTAPRGFFNGVLGCIGGAPFLLYAVSGVADLCPGDVGLVLPRKRGIPRRHPPFSVDIQFRTSPSVFALLELPCFASKMR